MMKKLLITVLTISMLAMAACGKRKELEITEEPPVIVSENEVEEEPTEVTGEAEEIAASANSTSGTLSDDLYSFQISIGGEVVSLPMTYDQFMELGFTPSSDTDLADLDQTLEPYDYSRAIYHKKGEAEIAVAFSNFSENVVPIKDCVVGAIDITTSKPDEGLKAENITLPKGIQYGVSTLEEVKAAYGEPRHWTEGAEATCMVYQMNSDNYVLVTVDSETNVVVQIIVTSFVPLKSGTSQTQAEKVSDEIPEIVTKYVAPTKLSDNLSDFTVEFDGDLYKLPVPVSEFVKNGWKIQEAYSDRVVDAERMGVVSLMRNNQTLDNIYVDNYAETKTGVQNCFIYNLKSKSSDSPFIIKVSEGIYMGMPEADFLEIIKGKTNVVSDTTSEDLDFYIIDIEDNVSNVVYVWIDKKTKIVQGLYVCFAEGAEESLSK